ncbi:hypothetical protein F5X96DRAFT_430734 [Biscogniauxia mediterranea]|nr:hypothetical protein F5X96DRAFT_430734 [Biscogniauxia mediterranea]
MAASERLRCPLLRCGEQFDDHESMLRHLTKCQYLSSGEYVCYECMKVERFNNKKCRCCLGHPTKRRRIINMAKHFFSNIGHKSRQGSSIGPSESEPAIPPPSYESLVVDAHQLYEEQEQQQQQQQHQQHQEEEGDDVEMHEPPQQPQIELNGTELLELDSTPLLPTAQLDSINYDLRSTNAPTSSNTFHTQPKLMLAPSVNITAQDRDSSQHYDANFMPSTEPSVSGCRRPSLALDTSHLDRYRSAPRQTYLSPSSSLRSTRSSQGVSPITPWSASSKSSSAWTTGSNVDTAMTSPLTPFGTNDYPIPSTAENHSFGEKGDNHCSTDPCSHSFGNMPELPGDNPLSMAFPHGLSDPLFFSFNPKDNYSWMSSVDTEISLGTSVNMMFADTSSKPEDIPSEFLGSPDSRSDTRALVGNAWDTLQQHISSSKSKLAHIQGNPLVGRLQGESTRTIALTGLASLKKILNGNGPTDPFDYLCFVHVMYAFSLIMYEDDLVTRCNTLYNQALAYKHFFDTVYPDFYSQIVAAIWQPMPEQQSQSQSMASFDISSSLKGKESAYVMNSGTTMGSDPLITTGQNFLDTLETSVININSEGPEEVIASELWMTHAEERQTDSSRNNPFTIAASYIIRMLCEEFQGARDLQSRLRGVSQRLQRGIIGTVRRLELELIQAGQETLVSSIHFDKFIPQVRALCDPIYVQQGFHSRTRYQVLGVSLIEALVRSIAHEPQPLLSLGLDPFEYLWQDFVGPADMGPGFPISVDSGSSVQQHQHPQQQQPINPLSNPSNFDSVVGRIIQDQATPSTQASEPQYSKQTTTTAPLHPETTGGSLVVPAVSSPDCTPEITTTISNSPGLAAASAHGSISERFGAGTSGEKSKGPSYVASTGQKVEASDCCEICGYRPKGDPQWFKGSMAKHKKLQHSTGPPTIYKCPFPGCNSQYKNRQDNLRQHQIEKNHFVGDEAQRRPHKRKKLSQN